MADTSATPGLKHLAFVPNAIGRAYGLADSVYAKAKSFTPASLDPYVKTVETNVAKLSAPVVTRVTDLGDRVLHTVDDQADRVITTANGLLSPVKSQAAGSVEKAKALHEAQMRNFHTARAAYFEWVEKYADWVASKLNPSPVLDGARERLKASIETAKTMTDPDGAVDTVHQAWLKFASFGPVPTVLRISEPYTVYSLKTYEKLHDTVVASPYYKRAVDTGLVAVDRVAANSLVQKALGVALPLVSPVKEKLQGSKYVSRLIEHVKPVHVKAA